MLLPPYPVPPLKILPLTLGNLNCIAAATVSALVACCFRRRSPPRPSHLNFLVRHNDSDFDFRLRTPQILRWLFFFLFPEGDYPRRVEEGILFLELVVGETKGLTGALAGEKELTSLSTPVFF